MATGDGKRLPSALETALERLSIADAARARPRRLELGAAPRAELAALELEALEWSGEFGRHFDMEGGE